MTALGEIFSTDGVLRTQTSYTIAQFDKSNNTLAQITGVSLTLTAGRSYYFRAYTNGSFTTQGGYKFGWNGTAVLSSLCSSVVAQYNSGANNAGVGALTALNSSFSGDGITGNQYYVFFEGGLTCSTGGTFYPQFAQKTTSVPNPCSLIAFFVYLVDIT